MSFRGNRPRRVLLHFGGRYLHRYDGWKIGVGFSSDWIIGIEIERGA